MLILVFGIIEFGIIYNAKVVLTSAAREGARKAAVTANYIAIHDAINNSLNDNINNVVMDIRAKNTITEADEVALNDDTVWWYMDPPSGSLRTIGSPVYVYLRGKVNVSIPIISSIVGDYVIISSSAVMRIEYGT